MFWHNQKQHEENPTWARNADTATAQATDTAASTARTGRMNTSTTRSTANGAAPPPPAPAASIPPSSGTNGRLPLSQSNTTYILGRIGFGGNSYAETQNAAFVPDSPRRFWRDPCIASDRMHVSYFQRLPQLATGPKCRRKVEEWFATTFKERMR